MDWDAALKGHIEAQPIRKWEGTVNGHRMTLHARPLTPSVSSRIKRRFKDGADPSPSEIQVEMIFQAAITPDGDRVFSDRHRALLMRLDNELIADIYSALFGNDADGETEEQFEERVGN